MAHLWSVGELDDLLDERLATVIGGVRLAGHDQLERPPLVGITQHQSQAFVRRHPAGESDGEHLGIESRCDPAEFGLRSTSFQPRPAQPRADVVDEQRAQLRADRPQMAGVDLLQPLPGGGFGE